MSDFPKEPAGAIQAHGFEVHEFKPMLKRAFDIVGSLVLIAFLLPLFVIIAALVYTQVGPRVIFAHQREGKDGIKFGCLKFRTMFLDADKRLDHILETNPEAAAEWYASRKLKDDPRILPGIGNFLRRSSIDELPQLFNVLLGHMSLVGPRPVIEDEIAYYGDAAQLYYSVRPGMTGPWQIGGRSCLNYETRVAKDAEYVKTWSLKGDVVILVKTAIMVAKLKSDDAY